MESLHSDAIFIRRRTVTDLSPQSPDRVLASVALQEGRTENERVRQGTVVRPMPGRARALAGHESAHRPAAQTLNQAVGHGVVPR